jgi:Mg-chelatase subunit ChlD
MTFAFVPEYAWQLWAAGGIALATALGFAIAWRLTGPHHFGGSRRTRVIVTAMTAAAAVLFSIALCAPTLFRRGDPETFHVVVLLDVSDSMARGVGGLARVRQHTSERLRKIAGTEGAATAQVLTFRSDVVAFGPVRPMRRIADQIDELTDSAYAVGAGTNIANGLMQAGDGIDRMGGRGAVVLVSDGNETDGDGLAAARHLAARGIAIHVLPVAGGPPSLGIVSANLPPHVDAGSRTFVRGVIGNAADAHASATVALVQQALSTDRPNGEALDTRSTIQVGGRQWAQFRTPVFFTKPGLQFVDVAVGGSGPPHRRRLFTHVERTPRVLAIGDDRWIAAFPTGAIEAVRKEPGALGADQSLEDFDAVVLDSVPAGAFAPGALHRIAGAVKTQRTGLFVMNGRHTGSAVAATNLMTYDDTPLEPLLPLVSQARARQTGPPPRHVVMLVDTSGSMCGAPLASAQRIAVSIVESFLRSEDLLDLMAFTTSASARLTEEPMTAQGKARAIDEIRRMACDGGTDPTEALQKLAARRLKNCGLLFFSDGGFGPLQQLSQYRPDCRTTVFGIRPQPFRVDEPMSALADPIHVDAGFDPSRLKIPYFEPDAKNHFFEPGTYTPLSMKHVLPSGYAMDVPAMPLSGSATTSPKDDVVPVAVRPKLTDPVLAYRDAGTANVGELTTTLPAAWLAREDGRAAIRQWIEAVLPAVSSRRYTFELAQQGNELELEIALAPDGNHLPEVDRIEASLDLPGASALDVPMRRDETAPATFRGRIVMPQSDRPVAATLVLKESGAGALARPQRIAMLVPSRQEVSGKRGAESLSFGLNEALLREIANQGTGSYNALERLTGARISLAGRRIDLWPFAAFLGCMFYLTAILVRRVDS